MSCRTCKYVDQHLYSLGNGMYGEHLFCQAQKEAPEVNPDDICEHYKDRFAEVKTEPLPDEPKIIYDVGSGVVIKQYEKEFCIEQEANMTNKKCAWLNKKGECVVNEGCFVMNPECNGCKYFEESKYDPVSHPDHYTAGRKFEPKDVIRDWDLNFNLGNAVKYISRAGRKNDLIEDLKKARQYLDFEIEYLEKK